MENTVLKKPHFEGGISRVCGCRIPHLSGTGRVLSGKSIGEWTYFKSLLMFIYFKLKTPTFLLDILFLQVKRGDIWGVKKINIRVRIR